MKQSKILKVKNLFKKATHFSKQAEGLVFEPLNITPSYTSMGGPNATNKELVKKVQEALLDANPYTTVGDHGADGIYGPKTFDSVKFWKSNNGLPDDGKLDLATVSKLLGEEDANQLLGIHSAPTETSVNPDQLLHHASKKYAQVKPGGINSSNRELVMQVQTKLGLTPDGAYGPGTMAAVKQWQTDNGVAPTGKLDVKTVYGILGESAMKYLLGLPG